MFELLELLHWKRVDCKAHPLQPECLVSCCPELDRLPLRFAESFTVLACDCLPLDVLLQGIALLIDALFQPSLADAFPHGFQNTDDLLLSLTASLVEID